MARPRIGDFLRQSVHLCDQDIDEILEEQILSSRRFGEIAISWGLCGAEDVWHAWFNQLAGDLPWIDLQKFGIDSQAINAIPPTVALQFRFIPVRLLGNDVVVAIGLDADDPPADKIAELINRPVRFVYADPARVDSAIATHYGRKNDPARFASPAERAAAEELRLFDLANPDLREGDASFEDDCCAVDCAGDFRVSA